MGDANQNVYDENIMNQLKELLKMRTNYEKTIDEMKVEISSMKQQIETINQTHRLEKEQMQNDIRKMKDNIAQLKNKLKSNETAIQENFGELEQLKMIISKIEVAEVLDRKLNMESFNKLEGEKQKSVIDEMISIDNSPNIYKIGQLLYFLSNENLNSQKKDHPKSYIYFPEEAFKDNSIDKIGISSLTTEMLYENESLNSEKLRKHINNFSVLQIEIAYPSDNFDTIYESVVNIKNDFNGKVEIRIFITGIKKTNKKFYENEFIDSVKIDSTVEVIAGSSFCGSFQHCKSLKHVILPKSLKSIGGYAFRGCQLLKEVCIPPSIEYIGNFAFSNCTSLKTAIVPSSTKEIGNCTFNKCSSIENILISKSVSKIGKASFFHCSSLKDLYIPSSADSNEILYIEPSTSVTRV